MYNNPKTQGREAKKMAEAHATALVFDPIKLNPQSTPCGLISDLGLLFTIHYHINKLSLIQILEQVIKIFLPV